MQVVWNPGQYYPTVPTKLILCCHSFDKDRSLVWVNGTNLAPVKKCQKISS